MSQPHDKFPSDPQALPKKPYPKLPAVADLPPFSEEGERDPFGQNENMLNAAIRNSFRIAIHLATLAHSNGLCMMLPRSETGSVDPSLRPWRSVVSCEPDELDFSSFEIPPPEVCWDLAHGTSIQNLTQRAALCVTALSESASEEAHDKLAELLEDLGYIALGREFYSDKLNTRAEGRLSSLRFFYNLGTTAATLHDRNIIHGDMTTDNFLCNPDNPDDVVISDAGSVCFLERTITLEERASDIGLLKLTCSFEEWEAIKLGYREQAPALAAQVFKFI